MYFSYPSTPSSFFTSKRFPSKAIRDTLLKNNLSYCFRYTAFFLSYSPFSKNCAGNGIKGKTVFLQPQCFQSWTLTDLWSYEPDLVTVEDKLSGLQPRDLGWYGGDLVTGEVQHV